MTEKHLAGHGFETVSVSDSRELHGRCIRMIHTKTGAELFWLDNGAENMVFSIGFRTLPEDNTGVFHILEHSVLCGSAKYPVKEPFVELMKSSMNTFLNAMTFSDMTMYPVASRNPRDLLNLTGVYLDAVFHPRVIHDPKRFYQEGWHIDRDEEGKPAYKGVVFNEMKGAMSDTDTLIDRQIMKQLFPDTCYGFNSGGDPEAIPDLTFEQFRETYHRFYHPSNALIYLDGAVPIEEMLDLIDGVLREFDRREELPVYRMQEATSSEKTIFYELAQDQDAKNRGHLSIAKLTGTWRDRAKNDALGIIADVLTGNNESPLKRAVLEKGLAQDLSISIDDDSLQSWVTIHAENVTDGKEAELMTLLTQTGKSIAREGLDRDAAEASMNRFIFHLREEDEPQGISRAIRCTGDWIFGGDPRENLENESAVRELREMLENGELDRLAADLLLNTDNRAILHTLPSKTLGEEKRRAEEERLSTIVNNWSEAERAENELLIDELEAWQNEEDDPEALATLPMLRKEDADLMPEWVEPEITSCHGVPVLSYTLPCNGVVYFRTYFSLTDLPLEEIPVAGLLVGMLGKLSTRSHDAFTLQKELKRYTGAMGFTLMIRAKEGEDKTCTPYLVGSCSALAENAEKARELMAEILTETRLDETDRIYEMIQQTETAVQQRVVNGGHLIAVRHALSGFSAEGAARNMLDGPPGAAFVHRFIREKDAAMAEFTEAAQRILDRSIGRKRMLFSSIADEKQDAERFLLSFPEGTETGKDVAYDAEATRRCGFRIPAQIGYAARGYRLSRSGAAFSGSLYLACSILSLGYLWNKVRVQGGAYGAGIHVDRNGNLLSYSFRDPTPGKTLEADAGASGFLRDFAKLDGEMDKYIISSLNELNPLMNSRDKGFAADIRYLAGYTRAQAEKIRKEILYATPEDLAACGKILDAFAAEGNVCIVAHTDALRDCDLESIRDL